MTDRELLEAAAKAAGIALNKPSPWFIYHERSGFQQLSGDGSQVTWSWSPLTDDGDALRLAVKLGLRIAVVDNDRAEVDAGNDDGPLTWQAVNEQRDIYAATRRAIVRAAAAIGAGK